jgi:uncharacterized protein (DUF433 family)
MKSFENIIANPEILNGKPCIKGTRISVELILEFLSNGSSVSEIIANYPHLNKEMILEAISFASKFNNNEIYLGLALKLK